MEKSFYFIAHNGAEIIDSTPEAEIRLANMEEAERLFYLRKSRKRTKNGNLRRIIHKLAYVCGIM